MNEIGPMTLDEAKTLVAEVAHWHHAFEIYPGDRQTGSNAFRQTMTGDPLTFCSA
jgi:hypothetical protein